MDWVCQLGDGYMLGVEGERLWRVNTGYPYPTLSRPQMDMLYDFLQKYSDKDLSWRGFESRYEGYVQQLNDRFLRSGTDCLEIMAVFSSSCNDSSNDLECIYRTGYWSAYKVLDGDDTICKLGNLYSDSQFYSKSNKGVSKDELVLIVPDRIYDKVSKVLPIHRDSGVLTTVDNYIFEGLPFAILCRLREWGSLSYTSKSRYCHSDRMGYFLYKLFSSRARCRLVQDVMYSYASRTLVDNDGRESQGIRDFLSMFQYDTLETSYKMYGDLLLSFGVECVRREVLSEFLKLMERHGGSRNHSKFKLIKVRGFLAYYRLGGIYDAYTSLFVNNEDKFGVLSDLKQDLYSYDMFNFGLKEVLRDDTVILDFSNLVDKDIAMMYFKNFYCDAVVCCNYDFDPIHACKEFLLNVGVDSSLVSARKIFLCGTLDFAKGLRHPVTTVGNIGCDVAHDVVYLFFYSLYYDTMRSYVLKNGARFEFKDILACFEDFKPYIDYDLLLRRYAVVFKKLLLYSKNTLNYFCGNIIRKDLVVNVSEYKTSIEITLVDKE